MHRSIIKITFIYSPFACALYELGSSYNIWFCSSFFFSSTELLVQQKEINVEKKEPLKIPWRMVEERPENRKTKIVRKSIFME